MGERKREKEREREREESKLYRCKERGSGGEQCAERDGELEGRWASAREHI